MNAIKRIRYGEKERARLENMLKAAAEDEAAGNPGYTIVNFKSQGEYYLTCCPIFNFTFSYQLRTR